MMRFSRKTEYALLAAMDLAEHYEGERPVPVSHIAARTGSPPKYLAQILPELKGAAIANSTRGPKGGYWLMRRPELISAAEVIAAVEPERRRSAPAGGIPPSYGKALEQVCDKLGQHVRSYLSDLTLADLLFGASQPV